MVIAPYDGAGSLLASPSLEIGSEIGVKATGDLEVTGKLTVGGLIDPTGLDLVRQDASPISGSRYGIWTSDGTVAGTTDGRLYWDSAGGRRALTRQQHSFVYTGAAIQSTTLGGFPLTVAHSSVIVEAWGRNLSGSAQTVELVVVIALGNTTTILSQSVAASASWSIRAIIGMQSTSSWTSTATITHGSSASTTTTRDTDDLSSTTWNIKLDSGSASGTIDGYLIDKRDP